MRLYNCVRAVWLRTRWVDLINKQCKETEYESADKGESNARERVGVDRCLGRKACNGPRSGR